MNVAQIHTANGISTTQHQRVSSPETSHAGTVGSIGSNLCWLLLWYRSQWKVTNPVSIGGESSTCGGVVGETRYRINCLKYTSAPSGVGTVLMTTRTSLSNSAKGIRHPDSVPRRRLDGRAASITMTRQDLGECDRVFGDVLGVWLVVIALGAVRTAREHSQPLVSPGLDHSGTLSQDPVAGTGCATSTRPGQE